MIYLSWKLCSGMAHSDLLDDLECAPQRVELPGAPEGTGSFKIEANVKLLMYVTTLATNLTRQGWQLYDQRCSPPPGHRRLGAPKPGKRFLTALGC